MNAEQAIKKEIMLTVMKEEDSGWVYELNDNNVDDAYEDLMECFPACDYWQDAFYEFRSSGEETDIECDGGRYYEADSVAIQLTSGQWVGWTYYYGGGKHSEPEAIDWIEDAYFLDVEEKEVTITKREFTKID